MFRLLFKEKGFTLIEILVVIVIVGILVVVLLPRLDFISGKARESGIKNNFHSFQTSAESYMRDIAGNNPTESGLNSYLDSATQFTSGASKLKDPWGNYYLMSSQKVSNSESFIVFRSTGKDTTSETTDPFGYSGSGKDLDDSILLVHYKNGVVKSCTTGLSNNIGSMSIQTGPTGTVDYDMPLSFRTAQQALHPYEYAIDINYVSGGIPKIYRTYAYTNSPTIFNYAYQLHHYDYFDNDMGPGDDIAAGTEYWILLDWTFNGTYPATETIYSPFGDSHTTIADIQTAYTFFTNGGNFIKNIQLVPTVNKVTGCN